MVESDAKRLDLTQMGVWGKQLRVEFGDRYEEVWIQTIGDRTEAFERGHEAMQRKLLEFRADGERRRALAEALLLAPPSDLAEFVIEGERAEMQSRLRPKMPDPVEPRRDTAAGETSEQFAHRMAAHEDQCRRRAVERAARLEEVEKARREDLLALPQEELAELALPRRIDIECWNTFARTCDDWVLLRAVRRADDHEKPYFEKLPQVQELHPAVKEQLRRAYRELEPAQGETLPKSSAPTQDSDSTT